MPSILTLSIGEFELIHDLFSLLIAAMGASALFFLLSRKQVAERFQPILLIAGMVALIGCYHAMRLFHSWNEAFELAGNSYAASGHFFHELYRYSDWILTMPLLLLELVLIADSKKNNSLLQQLIGSALLSIFFTYFGASNFAERGAWMRWSGWGLSVIFFLYMAWKLIAEVSINPTEQADLERKFFLKARNLFLLSWSFYPLATLGILCHHGLGEVELMIFLMSSGIADFASKCGVSFYLYRAAKVSSQKFRGTLTK